jgi:AcrR family transcriptional regulator
MPATRRDVLVDAALTLFCRDGFHATGIDAILAEAGVAKMTLYRHFRSKEELILAALRRRDEVWRNWFRRTVERRARVPRERLLAVFDVLDEWQCGGEFRGCVFINATAEYAAPDHPIHEAAAEHLRLVTRFLRELADAAGAPDPDDLATRLALLLEGATVLAHVCGRKDAARHAKAAAAVLVEGALAG